MSHRFFAGIMCVSVLLALAGLPRVQARPASQGQLYGVVYDWTLDEYPDSNFWDVVGGGQWNRLSPGWLNILWGYPQTPCTQDYAYQVMGASFGNVDQIVEWPYANQKMAGFVVAAQDLSLVGIINNATPELQIIVWEYGNTISHTIFATSALTESFAAYYFTSTAVFASDFYTLELRNPNKLDSYIYVSDVQIDVDAANISPECQTEESTYTATPNVGTPTYQSTANPPNPTATPTLNPVGNYVFNLTTTTNSEFPAILGSASSDGGLANYPWPTSSLYGYMQWPVAGENNFASTNERLYMRVDYQPGSKFLKGGDYIQVCGGLAANWETPGSFTPYVNWNDRDVVAIPHVITGTQNFITASTAFQNYTYTLANGFETINKAGPDGMVWKYCNWQLVSGSSAVTYTHLAIGFSGGMEARRNCTNSSGGYKGDCALSEIGGTSLIGMCVRAVKDGTQGTLFSAPTYYLPFSPCSESPYQNPTPTPTPQTVTGTPTPGTATGTPTGTPTGGATGTPTGTPTGGGATATGTLTPTPGGGGGTATGTPGGGGGTATGTPETPVPGGGVPGGVPGSSGTGTPVPGGTIGSGTAGGPGVILICTKPDNWWNVAQWLDYGYCYIISWFTWSPRNSDDFVVALGQYRSHEPMGTIAEFGDALVRAQSRLDSQDWNSFDTYDYSGFDGDVFIDPETSIYADDSQLAFNTGGSYGSTCALSLPGAGGPFIMGVCFTMNFLYHWKLLSIFQWVINGASGLLFVSYIVSKWISKASK